MGTHGQVDRAVLQPFAPILRDAPLVATLGDHGVPGRTSADDEHTSVVIIPLTRTKADCRDRVVLLQARLTPGCATGSYRRGKPVNSRVAGQVERDAKSCAYTIRGSRRKSGLAGKDRRGPCAR